MLNVHAPIKESQNIHFTEPSSPMPISTGPFTPRRRLDFSSKSKISITHRSASHSWGLTTQVICLHATQQRHPPEHPTSPSLFSTNPALHHQWQRCYKTVGNLHSNDLPTVGYYWPKQRKLMRPAFVDWTSVHKISLNPWNIMYTFENIE